MSLAISSCVGGIGSLSPGFPALMRSAASPNSAKGAVVRRASRTPPKNTTSATTGSDVRKPTPRFFMYRWSMSCRAPIRTGREPLRRPPPGTVFRGCAASQHGRSRRRGPLRRDSATDRPPGRRSFNNQIILPQRHRDVLKADRMRGIFRRIAELPEVPTSSSASSRISSSSSAIWWKYRVTSITTAPATSALVVSRAA